MNRAFKELFWLIVFILAVSFVSGFLSAFMNPVFAVALGTVIVFITWIWWLRNRYV